MTVVHHNVQRKNLKKNTRIKKKVIKYVITFLYILPRRIFMSNKSLWRIRFTVCV